MFEQATSQEPRNQIGDWVLRGGIGLAFILFGAEKFSTNSQWIGLFQQIGAGQWFRYVTGVVEVLGGVLVIIPWTATIGLALLACTMAGAALILVFAVGRPADSVFSGVLFLLLATFWWNRRAR
jgi:putative oxidoreductase